MFDGRDPVYRQIADQIRDDVLSGALAEEEQVMSTTQFATTYRINPATAAKGVNMLVDKGILVKRRGIGMFVAPGARAALLAERREVFGARFVQPLLDEARALGLSPEDLVTLVRERADVPAPAPSPASAPATTPMEGLER